MAHAPIEALCKELGIEWNCVEHEPIKTVEEGLSLGLGQKLGGAVFAKNLFLKDKKAGIYLLTVAVMPML